MNQAALRNSLLSLLLAATAGYCSGQTITSGNASLNVISIPFDSNFGNGTLRLDGPASPDQLYQYCWYYRTQNNNINRFFSSLDTPTTTVNGDRMTYTYTNAGPGPAGTERFNATIETRLEDGAAPNSGRVYSVLTVQAASSNALPRTYNFFLLTDLDLAGGGANPATDDSISYNTTQNLATFTEASSSNYAQAIAENPTRFEVNTGTILRTRMNGLSANFNLNATLMDADVAAGFQWTVTLNPGQTAVLRAGFAINMPARFSPCTADFNGDGSVDFFDYLDFVDAFSSTSLSADFNHDGSIDFFDYLDFVDAFSAGC